MYVYIQVRTYAVTMYVPMYAYKYVCMMYVRFYDNPLHESPSATSWT